MRYCRLGLCCRRCCCRLTLGRLLSLCFTSRFAAARLGRLCCFALCHVAVRSSVFAVQSQKYVEYAMSKNKRLAARMHVLHCQRHRHPDASCRCSFQGTLCILACPGSKAQHANSVMQQGRSAVTDRPHSSLQCGALLWHAVACWTILKRGSPKERRQGFCCEGGEVG